MNSATKQEAKVEEREPVREPSDPRVEEEVKVPTETKPKPYLKRKPVKH